MRKFFKKMCIGACGLMFVPILAMVPVSAEDVPSAQIPVTTSGSVEETPTPTATPVASATATPIVTPSATPAASPTATPTVAAFKTLIPDENFRKAVNELIFDGGVKDDDNLTAAMQEKIGEYTGKLDIRGKEISNLLGIQYFTGITELDCSHLWKSGTRCI